MALLKVAVMMGERKYEVNMHQADAINSATEDVVRAAYKIARAMDWKVSEGLTFDLPL